MPIKAIEGDGTLFEVALLQKGVSIDTSSLWQK